MRNFLEEFYKIENLLHDKARFTVDLFQSGVSVWNSLDEYEKILNRYHYNVRLFILSYNPDLSVLLKDNDSEIRRVALKLIWDGLIDLSNDELLIKILISLSITGNDEERKLAQVILINRGWLERHEKILLTIVERLYGEGLDYYLFKDMGEFFYNIKNINLLMAHIEKGKNIQDDEINELIADFSNIIKGQSL
ncbi:hypothetical protein J9S84_000331 [Salmonella enterica]|uniref:HEAT repeat domain-containing protein n=3 Tax=Salmonella enterica TaxID=28901 RepID=A0A753ZEF9_SALER|nr:hypothetical protein [Salmonella enterica]EBE2902733.1 hypothetical protein [Salmonella enterica subsp. enterica serovar Krefeld]ECK9404887.1 hypothetical protein [Salmonella enterica subsp. enterica serovar Paratyphi C str. CFSAN000603]EDQ2562666.1 hypothetical protein [Salmonella enterica subsp. enterica serovar Langensalza]EDT5366681.1 hypothetical protein [Salmonella enterica subsp. enterica]HAB6615325.1 hypothetical protein [Salmonella enterica subsp. enterica serovar Paratyphi C]HAE8